MKFIIKYHDGFERAFRNAARKTPQAGARAMNYTINGLLQYVKSNKFDGNPLYNRSGDLRDSIQVETRMSGDNVYGVMGTDIGWIDVHERGAIIYPKTAPYLRFPLYERGTGSFLGWRTADSVTIPQRPVIGSTITERQSWVRSTLEHRFRVEIARLALYPVHGKRFGWSPL